jgi:hypothetical protein
MLKVQGKLPHVPKAADSRKHGWEHGWGGVDGGMDGSKHDADMAVFTLGRFDAQCHNRSQALPSS